MIGISSLLIGLIILENVIVPFYMNKKRFKIPPIFDIEETYFDKISKWKQVDRECIVCRDNLNSGQLLSKLECGHIDHLDCIKSWLNISNICPRCKTAVKIK